MQFDEVRPVLVVQNFAKNFIYKSELLLIEPKRDGKFQFLAARAAGERVVHRPVII